MFKAKTPVSVKREIKQEPNNPTIEANLPPKEYIDQVYETHVTKKKNKRPIPGSLNWYPSPLKATKRRKLKNSTKGKLLRVLNKATGWEDWEPQELFEYRRQVDDAIKNTLYYMDWRVVHTDWKESLLNNGHLIPVLSDHDIEWTKAVMEDKVMLNDILSFETVNFLFKYELYGLFHEDLNTLFDIERPGLWSVGIDEVD
ncbi:hypothetical protein OS493_024047 [Desmophyllum pertusum]|uniref:Uncharacterized protein n=1 Tax=Desmophyllum pertusum TaxID=174260 RepID=A0A9W9ZLP6_9CNID|nr:hypothetical protein OS493_024047 [Desmophyllum pertusum]